MNPITRTALNLLQLYRLLAAHADYTAAHNVPDDLRADGYMFRYLDLCEAHETTETAAGQQSAVPGGLAIRFIEATTAALIRLRIVR